MWETNFQKYLKEVGVDFVHRFLAVFGVFARPVVTISRNCQVSLVYFVCDIVYAILILFYQLSGTF